MLVTGQFDWLSNMECIMKAKALRDLWTSSYMASKKTLELNPNNAIVKDVRSDEVIISNHITDSPCVLVTGWSSNMERIMKAKTLHDSSMSSYMANKKTLELNLNNAIIQELKDVLGKGDKVIVSSCITDLPYVLITGQFGWSSNTAWK